jgi:hypothetical protein
MSSVGAHRFEWGRGSGSRELDTCGGAGPAGAAHVDGSGLAWPKEGERGEVGREGVGWRACWAGSKINGPDSHSIGRKI